jgi:predicted oxidoreductase
MVEFDRVHVETDHNRGIDQRGEIEGDFAASTADVDTALAGMNIGPTQQRKRVTAAVTRQQQQPSVTLIAAPDHVLGHTATVPGTPTRARGEAELDARTTRKGRPNGGYVLKADCRLERMCFEV